MYALCTRRFIKAKFYFPMKRFFTITFRVTLYRLAVLSVQSITDSLAVKQNPASGVQSGCSWRGWRRDFGDGPSWQRRELLRGATKLDRADEESSRQV